jgi:hypothetical protein
VESVFSSLISPDFVALACLAPWRDVTLLSFCWIASQAIVHCRLCIHPATMERQPPDRPMFHNSNHQPSATQAYAACPPPTSQPQHPLHAPFAANPYIAARRDPFMPAAASQHIRRSSQGMLGENTLQGTIAFCVHLLQTRPEHGPDMSQLASWLRDSSRQHR